MENVKRHTRSIIMPYITKTGKIIEHGEPFTLSGVDYGGSWLSKTTPEEHAAIGITWEDDPVPIAYNPKFFSSTTAGGVTKIEPLDLEPLKANMTDEAKRIARAMLGETDWMVIRKIDSDEPIPDDVSDFRAAVRAEENRIESEVAAADFEAIQLIENNWPDVP